MLVTATANQAQGQSLPPLRGTSFEDSRPKRAISQVFVGITALFSESTALETPATGN